MLLKASLVTAVNLLLLDSGDSARTGLTSGAHQLLEPACASGELFRLLGRMHGVRGWKRGSETTDEAADDAHADENEEDEEDDEDDEDDDE